MAPFAMLFIEHRQWMQGGRMAECVKSGPLTSLLPSSVIAVLTDKFNAFDMEYSDKRITCFQVVNSASNITNRLAHSQ